MLQKSNEKAQYLSLQHPILLKEAAIHLLHERLQQVVNYLGSDAIWYSHKKIIQTHQDQHWAESTLLKGFIFSFHFTFIKFISYEKTCAGL